MHKTQRGTWVQVLGRHISTLGDNENLEPECNKRCNKFEDATKKPCFYPSPQVGTEHGDGLERRAKLDFDPSPPEFSTIP